MYMFVCACIYIRCILISILLQCIYLQMKIFIHITKILLRFFFFNIFKWCNVIGTRNIIRLSIHLLGFIDLLGEERALIEMITYKKL